MHGSRRDFLPSTAGVAAAGMGSVLGFVVRPNRIAAPARLFASAGSSYETAIEPRPASAGFPSDGLSPATTDQSPADRSTSSPRPAPSTAVRPRRCQS